MGVAKVVPVLGVLLPVAGAVALALTEWRDEPKAPAAHIDASDPKLVDIRARLAAVDAAAWRAAESGR
jgi:hypothetical protein